MPRATPRSWPALTRPLPFSIDWLPDGRLLIVSGPEGLLLRREPDGSLGHPRRPERPDAPLLERDRRRRPRQHLRQQHLLRLHGRRGVRARASSRWSAPTARFARWRIGLAFPNGMVVTPDNSTLIVAESFAGRLAAFDIAADGSLSNRRVWAELGEGGDGICMDAEGAVWMPGRARHACACARAARCSRRIELDRFCFACMLGGEDKQDAVHAGGRLARDREHRQGPADGQGADGPGAGRPAPAVAA